MAAKKKTTQRSALAISINLLPTEFRKKQKDFSWVTDRRTIWPTLALIAAIVCASMVFSYIDETINGLTSELERVRSEVEKQRPLLTKIDDLEKKQGVVNTKINSLKSIQVSKKRWVMLFENISSVLPPNMWITSINQIGNMDLEMKGTTFDFSEVAEYMVKLEKQVSVQNVSLVTISTTKVDGEEAYSFTIKMVMNQDLGEK
ncbi:MULTISPECIES: PilN domain-containing protein [unclassified Fibrobacter]|uniref:PilN domain-containing protein n=1 Tax=unclassified Fibrobacter TaxID=2634177 RepID=UPI000D6C5523|nr:MULTISPECIES: PilN domain-containing protein [unclassified Fibrobacter]PWJ68260.1 type IV pilus assembly protein PilN [Fibrobacter sp. UWR4]PZW72618.1 type IV pilus assembly protein PilN [Fibrobacter sp. UWR1]